MSEFRSSFLVEFGMFSLLTAVNSQCYGFNFKNCNCVSCKGR